MPFDENKMQVKIFSLNKITHEVIITGQSITIKFNNQEALLKTQKLTVFFFNLD